MLQLQHKTHLIISTTIISPWIKYDIESQAFIISYNKFDSMYMFPAIIYNTFVKAEISYTKLSVGYIVSNQQHWVKNTLSQPNTIIIEQHSYIFSF